MFHIWYILVRVRYGGITLLFILCFMILYYLVSCHAVLLPYKAISSILALLSWHPESVAYHISTTGVIFWMLLSPYFVPGILFPAVRDIHILLIGMS